jgi:hypothetical protein
LGWKEVNMDEYDIWHGLTYLNPVFYLIGVGVLMLLAKFWKR